MEYLIFFSLVFIASSFYLVTRKRNPASNTNLPPGSLGWPVIGETLELLMSYKNPETFILKRLAKHSTAEVFKTNILGENTVVFCSPEANKFVSANEGSLVRVWLPRSQQLLFGLDVSEKHNADKPHPAALSRLFSVLRPDSNGVEKFDHIAKERLKQHSLSCRAYELAKGFVLAVSCAHLLGMGPERAIEAAEAWRLDEVVKGIQWIHVDLPGTVFWRARKAAEEVRTKVESFMTEEVGESGDNLVSVLAASKVKVRIATANLVMGIMAASYGSVVATITFMVKLIGERPDVYDKIYSEQMGILALKGSDALNWNHINRMKYTWAVACETMRIQPPFLGTFREALTDFEYAGFTIPKGWKILWAFNVTNKNPDYFPDPEKFEPLRFMENEKLPFTFLPFGGGPRMCAGKEYARLAILTFFHNLVTNYKWDILSPGEKISGGMGLGLPVLTNGLPIRLHPHVNVTTK